MKKARVVIGANLGDEGKGLMTDYFVNRSGGDCLVVRFNGGAQAGHTVTLPEGGRHVFGHYGSGTFAGAPTYLSRFFVVNPILFLKETDRLKDAIPGGLPVVYADRDALLTTPYDMLINQAVEHVRGIARHGSCGIGFGETIERSLDPLFATIVSDLANPAIFSRKLEVIRDVYTPKRLKALGVEELPERFESLLADGNMVSRFMEDALLFRDQVTIAGIDTLGKTESIIFEGAQGLLLDEFHSWFPHVTRSRTGLFNAAILAREAEIRELHVTYVTRAYLTRHGAGPLPFELPGKPYEKIVDETNIHNPYQGSLRFAWLNLDLLNTSISNDLSAVDGLDIRPSFAVTCLDQIDGLLGYVQNEAVRKDDPMGAVEAARKLLGVEELYVSSGPTRDTVASLPVGSVMPLRHRLR